MKRLSGVLILLLLLGSFVSAAYDFSKIKDNVSEFTLPNGLKFILLEDHSVPIATFMTFVNVGGSDEHIGIWGISHFLEHMAFKGTSEIGTTDYKAEKLILDKMDEIFNQILEEKGSINPNEEKLNKLKEELENLRKKAGTYVVDNELDKLLKKNGAVGINAGTSKDFTMYFFSLPSNRLELWAYLESSRFSDPVFREFYKERDVIKEERRRGSENTPTGKLIEELISISFKDHPYGISGIGPMSNIDHITRSDMKNYFNSNYNTKNMVIGVVGDVFPDQLQSIAKKYFSKLKPGKKNSRVFTVEPPQPGEKSITIYDESQPYLILAYHGPSSAQEDFVKFSILDRILTSGRSSRLNSQMVIKDKTALGVFSFAGYPGSKYPGLFLFVALPNSGHTTDELLKSIDDEIESIKNNSITEEELESAKTRLVVTEIRRMGSNRGLLMRMLQSEMVLGSWQKAFDDIQAIEKITTSDIQELVKKYLVKSNRSIGRIEKKEEVKQ